MRVLTRRTVLGLSKANLPVEITEACLTHHQIVCRSCADACDVNAITFINSAVNVARPEVIKSLCTSCKACLAVCPGNAIKVTSEGHGR